MPIRAAVLLLICLLLPVHCNAQEDEYPGLEQLAPLLGAAAQALATGQAIDDPLLPTGDALFDAWAQATQLQIELGSYSKKHVTAGQLSGLWFDVVEERFGNDPRYWELRYLNALAVSDRVKGEPQGRYKQPVDILHEADRREAVRANTLLLIWLEAAKARHELRSAERREWIEANGWDGVWIKANDPRRVQFQAAETERLKIPLTDVPLTELAMLRRAIELAPDEAWPHYALAMDLIDLGRDTEALEEIRKGNTLKWVTPQPYPLSQVFYAGFKQQPLGNKRVSGAAMLLNVLGSPPIPLLTIRNARQAYFARHRQLTPEEAQVWHAFMVRLGTEPLEVMYYYGSLLGCSTLQQHVLDSWTLGAEERDVLLRLRGVVEAVKDADSSYYEFDPPAEVAKNTVAYGESGLYLTGWELLLHEVAGMRARSGYIALLRGVDYTQLRPTTALAEYPPVTREELKARTRARAVGRDVTGYLGED